MAGHPIGQLFSKLHEAFASPGGATHRLVIDRRTIEKTWKYMDKVIKCLERYHGIFKKIYTNFHTEISFQMKNLLHFRWSNCANIQR